MVATIAMAKAWLLSKHCTSWWDWDIRDQRPGGELEQAARHWVAQLEDFQRFAAKHVWDPPTVEIHEIVLSDRDGISGPAVRDLAGTIGDFSDRPYWEALNLIHKKGLLSE